MSQPYGVSTVIVTLRCDVYTIAASASQLSQLTKRPALSSHHCTEELRHQLTDCLQSDSDGLRVSMSHTKIAV